MTNYSVVPEKQQVKMSHTLSELSTGRPHVVEKSNLSQVSECFSTTVHSAGSAEDYQQGQQAMSLFTGAVIHGGQFNISISSLKDGAYYCYCAYVLRISRYSDFLSPMLTNTGIFCAV